MVPRSKTPALWVWSPLLWLWLISEKAYPGGGAVLARDVRICDAFEECEDVGVLIEMICQLLQELLCFDGFRQASVKIVTKRKNVHWSTGKSMI